MGWDGIGMDWMDEMGWDRMGWIGWVGWSGVVGWGGVERDGDGMRWAGTGWDGARLEGRDGRTLPAQ